ncbi:MAG: alpha/beta hydrolase [Wenzhouxiangellaceae bacterium]
MKPEQPLQPPPRKMLRREVRAVANLISMTVPLGFSLLRRKPGQRTQTVMVIPGFGADDRYTWPLRKYLEQQGYVTRGWGMGANLAGLNIRHTLDDLHPRWAIDQRQPYRGEGGVPLVIDRLIDQFDDHHHQHQPIALIGWSLGGYIAREVARERPQLISQVITLGTPTIGGPKYTAASTVFMRRRHDLDWIEQSIAERENNPIQVPITALISRSDGIVDYRASLDHFSPQVEHIDMNVAHLGFPFHRKVWRVILERLSRHENSKSQATG